MKSSDIFRVSKDTKVEFLAPFGHERGGVSVHVSHGDLHAMQSGPVELIPQLLDAALSILSAEVGRRAVRR